MNFLSIFIKLNMEGSCFSKVLPFCTVVQNGEEIHQVLLLPFCTVVQNGELVHPCGDELKTYDVI